METSSSRIKLFNLTITSLFFGIVELMETGALLLNLHRFDQAVAILRNSGINGNQIQAREFIR